MHLIPDTYTHRGETAFRHGFRIGGLPLPSDAEEGTFVLSLDVLDPIGRPMPVPGKSGLIAFDEPTVAVALARSVGEGKTARRRPMFMPPEITQALAAKAVDIGRDVAIFLVENGASPKAAGRVGLSVVSALQGKAHRPDYFGVKGWSPNLSLPFGVILSGPWVSEPLDADPIPAPAKPETEEPSA